MKKLKQIVTIKIGSSVLFSKENILDEPRITHIAGQIVRLRARGFGIILVVSGAVACGLPYTPMKQAAAGVGQAEVISVFYRIFMAHSLPIAQMLLTRGDIDSLLQQKNIAQVVTTYITAGIIPVINENDVIDLNSFDGNDYLSVKVARIVGCRKLLIMSTMRGSIFGVGGGEAKLKAVKLAHLCGVHAEIVNGLSKNILLGVV